GGMNPPQGGFGMPPQGMMPPGGNGTNGNRGPQFGGQGMPPQGMPPQMGQNGENNQRPSFGRPDQQGNFNRENRNNDRNGNRNNNRGGGGFGGPGGGGTKPIKAFVKVRWQSVEDQLEGKSEGMIPSSGFGPGGGGPGGNDRNGRDSNRGGGNRNNFGPGNMIAGPLFNKMDTEKTGKVDRELFVKSFEDWFNTIDTNKVGSLTEVELRRGLNKLLETSRGGFGGGPGGGFGGPGGMPPGGPGAPG
ncbi:MAG: hypothetical protein IKX46_03205, partial [Verrucomicrobia bacterium]|nr:hypothetical protein [Verrucomicrobiota bacterium]